MRYLPISSLRYLSRSPRFFESGKHRSYDHIKSPSMDTRMWEVWFGNVISFKYLFQVSKVGLGFCTSKIILLDGCLNWLGCLYRLSPCMEQLSLHPRAGPGTWPSFLVISASGQQPDFRSPWSDGSVFSPSFFNLTPPYPSIRAVSSRGLLASNTTGSKASLVILGIFHVHCSQVLTFCLNSHGQFKSRFTIHSDIWLFSEALFPPLSSYVLARVSPGC